MEKLGKILLKETEIDLSNSSIEVLQEQLEKVNEMEQMKKQELNDILNNLD